MPETVHRLDYVALDEAKLNAEIAVLHALKAAAEAELTISAEHYASAFAALVGKP